MVETITTDITTTTTTDTTVLTMIEKMTLVIDMNVHVTKTTPATIGINTKIEEGMIMIFLAAFQEKKIS